MAALLANQTLAPFLSRPMNFVRGLDPLGLQNTTEATYTLLLPGLNNVSRKIRYYSFYCWLLDAYGNGDGSLDPKDQHRFIRRAELIVALVNQLLATPSGDIPGTDFAANWLRGGAVVFDLESGTYLPGEITEGTYWKNPNGAFGQYYLGSMRDIQLIVEHPASKGLYARTPVAGPYVSGEEVAGAFAAAVPQSQRELFISAVKSGRISRVQLGTLTDGFNFSKPPGGSQELLLLKKALIQPDEPEKEDLSTVFRRRTVRYLLQTAADGHTDMGRAFTLNAYYGQGRVAVEPEVALTGWYYYQLNEFWQFTCLSILDAVLTRVEDTALVSWLLLDELVEEMAGEVAGHLMAYYGVEATASVTRLISALPDENESELLNAVKKNSESECIAYGLAMILRLKISNEARLDELGRFAERYQVSRDGDVVDFLLRMDRYAELSVADWIRDFLYTHILYRHQFVAFRKLGGGSLSTQLFLLEEGKIRFKNRFYPAPTSPRLDTLIGFFRDLELADKGGLTSDGRLLLVELSHD